MNTTPATSPPQAHERARFAIGHVGLSAGNAEALTESYIEIAMRPLASFGHMAIVELLDGTHIVISAGETGGQQLDPIVDKHRRNPFHRRRRRRQPMGDPSRITTQHLHRDRPRRQPTHDPLDSCHRPGVTSSAEVHRPKPRTLDSEHV